MIGSSRAPGGYPLRSDTRLSVAVMAHPTRAAAAQRLVDNLAPLDAEVVFDPRPDGPRTALRTAIEAWSRVPRGATHHLVLQDDVTVCADFSRRVAPLIHDHPRSALALFAEWGSITAAAARVAVVCGLQRVAVADDYVPSQAVVLPAAIAVDFAEHARQLPESTPDDEALAAFLSLRGVPAVVPVPTLVQHDDVPSLVGNSPMGTRRSVCWLGDLPDGPEAGGAADVFDAAELPYLCWWFGMAVTLSERATPEHSVRGWTRTAAPAVHGPSTPGGDALLGLVRAAAAGEVERVARCLGAAAAAWSVRAMRPIDLGAAVTRPLVRAALRTMAPGGLRRFVPVTHLDALAACSEDFVCASVVAAAAHAGAMAQAAERAVSFDPTNGGKSWNPAH